MGFCDVESSSTLCRIDKGKRQMNPPAQKQFHVALIPGDGIGKEVVPPAVDVLEAVGRRHGFGFHWTEHDWGCDRFLALRDLDAGRWHCPSPQTQDAILLGAVGAPEVPDHVSLWGMLIPLRRELRQYVNLRPVRLLARAIRSPLADRKPEEIDFLIVRENNEGEYSRIGGRIYEGTDDEIVIQEAVFTRRGVDRIINYAYQLARTRPRRHLTSATKSNGIFHTMPFWDERFAAIGQRYPDVATAKYHIDILTAHFVQHPDRFDVVVGIQPVWRHPLRPGAGAGRLDWACAIRQH